MPRPYSPAKLRVYLDAVGVMDRAQTAQGALMLAEVNNGVSALEQSSGIKSRALRESGKSRAAASWQVAGCALFALCVVLAVAPARAFAQTQPLTLNPDVPLTYRVQPGDTLWDIAALYLRDPWRWQSLWAENPEIENPHLIFPGDVLRLYWEDGQPRLAHQGQTDIKLTPTLRASPLDLAIPAIPREQIAPFLSDHSVMAPSLLATSAYVVSGDSGRLISGWGDTLYARGASTEALDHRVVRPVMTLEDPLTGEDLGTFVLDVGEARARGAQEGDELMTMTVTQMRQEIRLGDRLLPVGETDLPVHYVPRVPQAGIENAFVIAVAGGLTQIGPLDIVLINRGAREALRVGDVLAIQQKGPSVPDPVTGRKVRLPDTRAGVLMTFAVYERVSFALVLEASRPMAVGDSVVNP